MNYQELLKTLGRIAPFDLAEDWDNSGIQIDTGKVDINSVLVCLDVTPQVVEEAISEGVDLIISHHPLFFAGAKTFRETIPGQKKVMDLIREDIGVIATHTNFDIAPGGNNDYVASLLGLDRVETVREQERPIALVSGYLPKPMTAKELFLHVQDSLSLGKGQIRLAGDPAMTIEKAALCTGAGADFLEAAKAAGCQALITGDVKHHEALEAAEQNMVLIDAGHFGTEKFFVENMGQQLRDRTNDLTVLESSVVTDPFMV